MLHRLDCSRKLLTRIINFEVVSINTAVLRSCFASPWSLVKWMLWSVAIQTFVVLKMTFQNGELFALETFYAVCEMSHRSCRFVTPALSEEIMIQGTLSLLLSWWSSNGCGSRMYIMTLIRDNNLDQNVFMRTTQNSLRLQIFNARSSTFSFRVRFGSRTRSWSLLVLAVLHVFRIFETKNKKPRIRVTLHL